MIDWDLRERETRLAEDLRLLDRRAYLDVCCAHPWPVAGHYPGDLGEAIALANTAIRELDGALSFRLLTAKRDAITRAKALVQKIPDKAETRDHDANDFIARRVRAFEEKLAELRIPAAAEEA